MSLLVVVMFVGGCAHKLAVMGNQDKAYGSIAFSPDNRHLLTVARDARTRVWDLQTGQLVGGPLAGLQDVTARFRPGTDEPLLVVEFGTSNVIREGPPNFGALTGLLSEGVISRRAIVRRW